MIELRRATVADLEALVPRVTALNEHEDIHLDPEDLRAALAHLLATPAIGQIFSIVRGGAPIGYALLSFSYDLEFSGREAWLTELWIDEDSRGGGAGAAALAQLEHEARALGVKALHLQVRPENPAARLYARLGWVASPRTVMTRRL